MSRTRNTDINSEARRLYDACPTVKPAWDQLGETTRSVWRDRAIESAAQLEQIMYRHHVKDTTKELGKHPLRLCTRCGGEEFVFQGHATGRCTFCSCADLRPATVGEAPPTHVYFGTGPYGWGLGATPEDAGANLLKNWLRGAEPRGSGALVRLWRCSRGTYCAQSGQLVSPEGEDAPELLIERII